jgi:predicted unusual protein kinase regulating ubiquinone biosynthesis (AarF/ABC1/UbiB family)
MGGVLIKVGQFLSSRLDMLPVEITSELAELQDEVPPEDFSAVREVAEAELGVPLAAAYAHFDEVPLAAASLGQVHRARLSVDWPDSPLAGEPGPAGERDNVPQGEPVDLEPTDVVVKVQRPDIEVIIATDLAALRTVGTWLHRYPPIRRRADVPALLQEFTRILYEEIDYLAEGRNAETLAANFEDQPGVRAPRVLWTHTTRRVLTLEDVYAIKITDYSAITAAGIDRAEVAQRLFATYLRQIFHDGFFHADPHPGNLFVSPLEAKAEEGQDWELTFVDFGMVGRVSRDLRAGLREMVIAAATQDAARLVKSYEMLGVLLPSADLELLEKAEAKAFEHFWGKSIAELRQISHREMREFAAEFRELVYTMPFQVPQDLILLGRTLAILSGMCTGLDPDFNLWNSVSPFAQELIAEEATSGWEVWLNELSAIARSLVTLPRRAESLLGKLERGELGVRDHQLADQLSWLEVAIRRLVGGVIFAALAIGGVQVYVAGQEPLGVVVLAGAAIAITWTLLIRRRTP